VRYTAKARMLSFDFLNDEVVYRLEPARVMLLAGMIARADNLGRLPGEPEVLLGFLFYPKSPRPDVMPDAVEGLLMTLARAERIAWYVAGGTRFVQFARWQKNQPGLKDANRKSTFPAPDDGVPVVIPGSTLEMFADETHAQADVRLTPPNPAFARAQASEQRAARAFDATALNDWLIANAEGSTMSRNDWCKFAAWLWKTGTKSMPVLMALLDECVARRPQQPYAYFKPGTETREAINMRVSMAVAEKEHKRIRDEEKAGKISLDGVAGA